ncbi:hypothetical protein BDZ91DRAFT_692572, partial [Kalaharituber pfeilii]
MGSTERWFHFCLSEELLTRRFERAFRCLSFIFVFFPSYIIIVCRCLRAMM